MKKIFYVVFIIAILICSGCSKENNNIDNNVDMNSITLQDYLFEKGYSKIGKILCEQVNNDNINRIGYINKIESETYMIINRSARYNLSLKVFSATNSNCVKSSDTNTTDMILDIIIDNAVDIYSSRISDRSFAIMDDNTLKKLDTLLNDIIIDDYGIKKYNGNYYDVVVNLNDTNEKLISLNGYGDYPILKTNKSYYYFYKKIINENECNLYADIDCEYEYVYELDEISKYYDEIIYYGNGIILDKDMNLYTRNVA